MSELLTYENHSRYFKECRYVYPVLSRRSEGVSLGINLNLNNACNWRCVYCQVDGLIRGKPDHVELDIIREELDTMLNWIVNGDFLANFAPNGMQRLNDICLAGNGEPTLSPDFVNVCELIKQLHSKYKLKDAVKTVLITNGSQLHQPEIQDGIETLAMANGEIWFKIDRVSPGAINETNQINLSIDNIKQKLIKCSNLCKTYIQSCWFKNDDKLPTQHEIMLFVDFIASIKNYIAGVLLYSTARKPALLEGAVVRSVNEDFLSDIANKLKQIGVNASYYV